MFVLLCYNVEFLYSFKFIRPIYCVLIFFILLYADIDDPIVYENDEWVSDQISVDLQERKPLHLSCFVNGNPTSTVRLGKSQNGRTAISSEAMDYWSNYSVSTGAKCSDTSTYVCYGKSQSKNLKTNKSIGVNILCEILF